MKGAVQDPWGLISWFKEFCRNVTISTQGWNALVLFLDETVPEALGLNSCKRDCYNHWSLIVCGLVRVRGMCMFICFLYPLECQSLNPGGCASDSFPPPQYLSQLSRDVPPAVLAWLTPTKTGIWICPCICLLELPWHSDTNWVAETTEIHHLPVGRPGIWDQYVHRLSSLWAAPRLPLGFCWLAGGPCL